MYCKHPVLSVPLSNEGKPSKPSVYDYNRVVRWEGLYPAARVLFIFYSVRSLRLFRLFDGHETLHHQQRATAAEKQSDTLNEESEVQDWKCNLEERDQNNPSDLLA